MNNKRFSHLYDQFIQRASSYSYITTGGVGNTLLIFNKVWKSFVALFFHICATNAWNYMLLTKSQNSIPSNIYLCPFVLSIPWALLWGRIRLRRSLYICQLPIVFIRSYTIIQRFIVIHTVVLVDILVFIVCWWRRWFCWFRCYINDLYGKKKQRESNLFCQRFVGFDATSVVSMWEKKQGISLIFFWELSFKW